MALCLFNSHSYQLSPPPLSLSSSRPFSLPLFLLHFHLPHPSLPFHSISFTPSLPLLPPPLVCNCDPEGSSSAVCDLITGQCDCQPNVDGQTCNTCVPGHFNLTTEGCTNCSCSVFSSSIQCSDSGQCPCPQGVGGATCGQCLPENYNITTDGCAPCACSEVGVRSSSNNCDPVTGQCPCISSTVGRDCAECPAGHFETDGTTREVCIECVCSGQTDSCTSDPDNYVLAAVQSDFTELCAQDPVACSDGWMLFTADGQIAAPYGPR